MNENLVLTCTTIISIGFNIPLFLDIFKNNNKEAVIKKVITLFAGCFMALIFSGLLIMPMNFATELNNNLVLAIYPIIVLTYLVLKFITFLINYFKVVSSKYNQIYVRDIFVDYSPAVLSLLINHKIEDKKDFDATILNIHAKKAIEFELVDDKLEIVDLQNQKAIFTLTEDERYIYNVLIQKEKFNKKRWHSIIRKQLDKRHFVKNGNQSFIWQIAKIYLILFGVVFLSVILFTVLAFLMPGDFVKNVMNRSNFNILLSILWISILIPFQFGAFKVLMLINKRKYIKDKMDYYTEKGALEMLKWKKFKDFIKDFSMIDTASAESVVIWEKYMAYAMAFNINKSYNSTELKKINQIIQQINLFE